MDQVVLVGDSVFDNAAYVSGPDVLAQVETKLGADWAVSLLAVDGSFINDVPTQLNELPQDAKIVILSAGGNDALRQTDLLGQGVSTVGEALRVLERVVSQFREDYGQLLDEVVVCGVQTWICTIYRPNFPDPIDQLITSTAVGLFNDVIIEEAARRELSILDIRSIFTNSDDYANPIEPSVQGGEKLSDTIVRLASSPGVKPKRASLIASGLA